jgi:hypothetical protein
MIETSPCEIIVGVNSHKHTHAAVAINTLLCGETVLPSTR